MNAKYENNPKLHLKDLYAFQGRVKNKVLGEEDPEWRSELEFLLERTKLKINEIKFKYYLVKYN